MPFYGPPIVTVLFSYLKRLNISVKLMQRTNEALYKVKLEVETPIQY